MINRMGFNNRGQPARVRAAAATARTSRGIVGVNIGANKDSADRIADYVAGVRAMSAGRRLSDDQHQLAQHAGLARSCRTKARSSELLAAVSEARDSRNRRSS